MKKSFISLLSLLSLFVIASCDNNEVNNNSNNTNNTEEKKNDNVEHEHTYNDTWSSDDTSHFHESNCEHTGLKKDVANHEFDLFYTLPPSLNEEGMNYYKCKVCNIEKNEKINKLEDKTNYTLKATLIDSLPGCYEAKVKPGDGIETDATLGIPSISKVNLTNYPTLETPAIIQGGAVGYDEKVPGKVEYKTIKERISPYNKFGHRIVDEVTKDAQGNETTHKKLSGFDGSYYIVRLDMSDILSKYDNLDNKYLHVKQENNKATMVMAGVVNGFDTGVKALQNADKTYKDIPTIDANNKWYFGENNPENNKYDAIDKQIFVDWYTGNWTINGSGFSDGMGALTNAYSLADSANILKDDQNGKPYIDIILMSSGLLTNGADTGNQNLSNDIKLSLYVDETKDYNPDLVYSFDANVVNDATKLLAKYYDETKITNDTFDYSLTKYTVMSSDLEIDVNIDDIENQNNEDNKEFWSLTKAIYYANYDSHTIKLICEVPVLEGLYLEGTIDNPRKVILDVNSFDIQVANHNVEANNEAAAAITVSNYATLEICDNTNTYGAELAIGNNASMVIKNGGTLIIDDSCTLEVEYDAATAQNQATNPQESQSGVELYNGEIIIETGGKIINNGVITIEGIEFKPTAIVDGQAEVVRNIRPSSLIICEGAILDNYGSIGVKGNLYILGTLNNYGKYDELITSGDPDKGQISHHKGIQLTWKDNVTSDNEADIVTNPDTGEKTYKINDSMQPGKIYIGINANNQNYPNAILNNYGDIALVPGEIYLYGKLNNTKDGNIYLCPITEAIIPIIPTQENPTQHEEVRKLTNPYLSHINIDIYKTKAFINDGKVLNAKIKIDSNGVLGNLTPEN